MRIAADYFFFFQAEDGIRDRTVTGVQTCALPILGRRGSTTTELTRRLVRPVLKSLQLSPPSVLLKTPPPWVPAYRVVEVWGSIARAGTGRFGSPALTALQLSPPSVLLKTAPPEVPA